MFRQIGEFFSRGEERTKVNEKPIVRFTRKETVFDKATGEQKDIEQKFVSILGVELSVYDGPEGSIFHDEEFDNFSHDEASLDLLKRYAIAAKLNQPILVEGETDIGKTKALEYLAHLTNHRLYRLSLSGQTDVTEFIGKYVPNTEDTHATFERLLRNRSRLSESSQHILQTADAQERGLTEEESREIASIEGMMFGEKVGWVWQDGLIPKAMQHDRGRGSWLYLDEVGAAEPQVLVKINRIFEKFGRLELSENGNRMVEGGDDFRLFGSTNPPEFAGRLPFAPDFLRRWVYQKIGKLTPTAISDRLDLLFNGPGAKEQPLIEKIGLTKTSPLDFDKERELATVIHEFLTEFFQQARDAADTGTVGKGQRQQFRYEFSDLIRVHDYLITFGGEDLLRSLKNAVEFYFTNKIGNPEERAKFERIVNTVMMAKNTESQIDEILEKKTALIRESEEERKKREQAALELADLERLLAS